MGEIRIRYDKMWLVDTLKAVILLVAFIAAVGFNGTSDPLIALFLPLLFLWAGTTLWRGVKDGWRVPKAATVLWLVLFWAYMVLNVAWSSVPYISVMFCFLIGTLPLVYFSVTMAHDSRRTAVAAMAGLALGWIGLAVWVLLQFYVFPATAGQRIHAPMLDPNNMAALLNMGMLAAAAAFLVVRGRFTAVAAGAAYILMYIASAATMSRAGLVIGGLCAALMLVLQWRHVTGLPRAAKALRLAIYIAVPFLAYALIDYKSNGWFSYTFTDLAHTSTSPSVRDRGDLLGGAWRMLLQHPFGDIGLGNFYYFYPAYRSPTDMSDGFFAHTDPLQLTLETGLPMAVLLYGFLTAVLVRTVRAWKRLPAGGMARAVMAGAFVALLSLIVHSHINYNLYMPGILIPAAVLMAVWYLASERAEGMGARFVVSVPAKRRSVAACGAVLVLLIAAQWPLRVGLSSRYIDRAQMLIQHRDYDAADLLLKNVARYGVRANFSIEEVQAQLELQRLHTAHDMDQRAAFIRTGLAYIQEARRYNPVFSTFMSVEAQFYFLGNGTVFPDGLDKALPLLQKAVKSNPLDLDAREGLAIIYQALHRPQDALRTLNEGLNWPRVKGRPDIDFLMITARAHEQAGDAAGAKMLTDMAEQRAKAYGLSIRR